MVHVSFAVVLAKKKSKDVTELQIGVKVSILTSLAEWAINNAPLLLSLDC